MAIRLAKRFGNQAGIAETAIRDGACKLWIGASSSTLVRKVTNCIRVSVEPRMELGQKARECKEIKRLVMKN